MAFVLVGAGSGSITSTATATSSAVPPVPTLVGIRASHHTGPQGGFDRVVFDFRGGLPGHRVRYVDRLVADGSGKPVRVAGRAVLQVRLSPADAHTGSGAPTAPRRVAFALPNVMTAVRSGDFEAVTTYGLGLAKRTPFRVFTLRDPARVVVDVQAGFRTVPRRVWFLDQDRFAANQEPFFVARSRPVPIGNQARGVLDRLFAGPLPAERAQGLRLLRSGATGLTGPSFRSGVARTRMLGGCSSGGSTVSLAGEAIPALKQFPNVSWVKILDPDGNTETPLGRSDSIPECLEP
jgi:hypothetical protein